MRNIGILMGLAGVIVCGTAAGCSDGSDEHKSSALSFTLTGDGSSLELHGAPASRDRHALYPLGGFTKMAVKVSPEGDLSATCENGRATVDCPEIPFFASVKRTSSGYNHVEVYDIYGYKSSITSAPGVTARSRLRRRAAARAPDPREARPVARAAPRAAARRTGTTAGAAREARAARDRADRRAPMADRRPETATTTRRAGRAMTTRARITAKAARAARATAAPAVRAESR